MQNVKKSRKCICCGKEYRYCGNCAQDRYKPTYFALYCSENCHEAFSAANELNFGHISKEAAQKKLKTCDLSELDSFNEIVKKDIKKIIAEPEEKVAPTQFKKAQA